MWMIFRRYSTFLIPVVFGYTVLHHSVIEFPFNCKISFYPEANKVFNLYRMLF
jgi:hypothetical protein